MPACAGIWPALTAVFSVHMLGYHYGIAQYAFLILITLVVSVGTVGVTGTATITSTAVFAALGLPIELVVVFAPISTIVDMARTMTNVTGAATAAVDVIVAVPGTPTVPTDTTNVIRIRNAYCAIP